MTTATRSIAILALLLAAATVPAQAATQRAPKKAARVAPGQTGRRAVTPRKANPVKRAAGVLARLSPQDRIAAAKLAGVATSESAFLAQDRLGEMQNLGGGVKNRRIEVRDPAGKYLAPRDAVKALTSGASIRIQRIAILGAGKLGKKRVKAIRSLSEFHRYFDSTIDPWIKGAQLNPPSDPPAGYW